MTLRLGFIALSLWLAPAIFSSVPASAETPFVPPPEAQTPGGPPEARNCSIPYPERKKPDFDPNGKLSVDLDEATAKITFVVAPLPEEATCFVIGRPGAPSWPDIYAWDEVAVPTGEVTQKFTAPSAGEYCFALLFGSPLGHSGMSEPVCIQVSPDVAPTPTATPTSTVATPRPPVSGPEPTATPTPAPPEVGTGRAGAGGVPPAVFAGLVLAVGGALFLSLSRRVR